ncbi:helix-turn-helix transcriptional regulator [Rhizobacter sp. Root1221]|uniref:ArsR/SmtB family transcription factor n=1 Tax=Rhizobacter sp. Root1221 TaxID=1736433 RepID=UPI0009E757AC|nr:helix-turn-helix transcriptional regulator [Rhizobacter sp. Root1221]
MDAEVADSRVARVAAAIAEPARSRMLCCLMDGRARTATELSVVAGVGASTASAHLTKLRDLGLVAMLAQGKHRYFRLAGPDVARALEALLVLADGAALPFKPGTPPRLRAARTCYDHIAGELGVHLHDHLLGAGWLVPHGEGYDVTAPGEAALASWGVDVAGARAARRRFACPCMDWSERRVHLAGSLGAAVLQAALVRQWVVNDLDSRALTVTPKGRVAMGDGCAPIPAPPASSPALTNPSAP